MIKGASIKFTSYSESVKKILELLKVQNELKKFDKIILKPTLKNEETFTPIEFTESVIQFCLDNKNPIAEIYIAEGADGHDTTELYESSGYQNLAEKYSIGLIDLNETEVEEISNPDFLKFESINYPKILLDSCVISLPILNQDDETEISGSLVNMLGAYPAQNYAGFFSLKKNKIRKWPIKYSIHDIIKCKMPNFSVIDASKQGYILAGLPIEIDKQASKLLNIEWKSIPHLKLIDESFPQNVEKNKSKIY
jgi:uncharacterized protein (DUF362 family)